eukprot:8275669-Alexandrium_andersonii.AAC.1
MSASLVGSEMCIRDSRCVAASAVGGRIRRAKRTLPECRMLVPLLARACPVSYTHLTLPTICSV